MRHRSYRWMACGPLVKVFRPQNIALRHSVTKLPDFNLNCWTSFVEREAERAGRPTLQALGLQNKTSLVLFPWHVELMANVFFSEIFFLCVWLPWPTLPTHGGSLELHPGNGRAALSPFSGDAGVLFGFDSTT